MGVVSTLERGFGYLLLFFGLPTFTALYVLFHSSSVSSFFLQNLSNTVLTFTKNSFLASLMTFSLLNNILLLSGLVAIAGAALLLLGSEGYEGLSKVGTEVLVLSVISLVSVYVISSLVLPALISNVSNSSSLSSFVASLTGPLLSQVILVNVFFAVLGAILIALKFILPVVSKVPIPKHSKKHRAEPKQFSLYRVAGIPIGSAAFVLALVLIVVFNTGQSVNGVNYPTSSIAANSVSTLYQSAANSGTAAVFNASNYYFFSAPNLNNSYKGSVILSPSFEPFPITLPVSFSISKFGDPIRFDFSLNVSQFNDLINSFSSGNLSIPSIIKFTMLYNDSGFVSCSNIFTNGGAPCLFTRVSGNLSRMLMGINGSSVNNSLLGQMFGVLSAPTNIFSQNSSISNSSQLLSSSSVLPAFTFSGHVNYKGNPCSLFDINGNYSVSHTTGQACILDSNGLPAFLNLNEVISMGKGQQISFNVNFGLASSGNVTLASITSGISP